MHKKSTKDFILPKFIGKSNYGYFTQERSKKEVLRKFLEKLLQTKSFLFKRNSIKIMVEDVIELGGNITLIGFKELGPAKLMVIKKMVGNYARKIQEKNEFNNLSLTLKDKTKNELEATLKINDKSNISREETANLFFSIDKVLSKFLEK